jgi:hypothetical protein
VRLAVIKKTTTNAGEDVGTKEPSLGGVVNLCNHYGNQYRASLKN